MWDSSHTYTHHTINQIGASQGDWDLVMLYAASENTNKRSKLEPRNTKAKTSIAFG